MTTGTRTARVRATRRSGMRLPTSALVHGAWLASALLVLVAAEGWLVPLAALAAVAITWPCVGLTRAGIGPVLVGLCLLLMGVWLLLGVVMHGEGMGGDVLWVLPSWQPSSGGSFGGAVTTGQLAHALAQGLHGTAILAVLALGFRAVPADGWLRLVAMTTGRGAGLLGPTVCLGEALSEQSRDRAGLRAHGLDLPSSRLADLWGRATRLADEGLATLPIAREPGWVSTTRLLGGCALAVTGLVLAMRRAAVGGPELVALVVLVALLVGAALSVRGADRFTAGDVAPAAGCLALLGTQYLLPGTDPVATATALLVLPGLALLTREAA